jgi:hypothetical protein
MTGLSPIIPIPPGLKGTNLPGWSTASPDELDRLMVNHRGNRGLRLDNCAILDPDSPAAVHLCEQWEREGKLPPTPAFKTARGIVKRIYLKPDELNAKLVISSLEFELRAGAGFYDVLPPSHVKDSKKGIDGDYSWLPGLDPESIELAELPQEILDYFRTHARDSDRESGQGSSASPVGDEIPDHERNTTLASLAGTMRNRGMSQEEIEAALLVVNQNRCKPPLPDKDVRTIARSYAKYAPGTSTQAWPQLAPEALYGLAGDFVRLIEPHTEADPVALLEQFLCGFGNMIGRGAYSLAEADRHHANLFMVNVGESSKGRKGVSVGHVRRTLETIETAWGTAIKSGMSSGEGLIWQVRDQIVKIVAKKDKKTGITDYVEEIVDPGIDDKRLLVVESEFATVLRQLSREGNILSTVIRDAWDRGDLSTLTKNSPARATGAHISIIGHITKDELRRYLDRTEAGNGFGIRFMWFCVRRSKCLPEGGRVQDVNFAPLLQRLRAAVDFAQSAGEISRDDEARALWAKVYPELSDGKPGLVGALTSRAEAQVMRLSMVYALLDQSKHVKVPHLLAALALWDYSETSVKYIFGEAIGDPVADTIFGALKAAPDGLSRTAINNLFGRHQSSTRIQNAISELLKKGLITIEQVETGGRPGELVKLNGEAKKA